MRVLMFGGRNFNDYESVCRNWDHFERDHGPITGVIHGDARGADRCCAWVGYFKGVPLYPFPAECDNLTLPGCVVKHQRRSGRPYNATAGHFRNQEMIDIGLPSWGMGFPGGSGTADMADRLLSARIPIWDAGYIGW